MTTVIPEIRVYSPSELGDDSVESDIDYKLTLNYGTRKKPRPNFGSLTRGKQIFLGGSPASRCSGDAASSENSISQSADEYRDTGSPFQKIVGGLILDRGRMKPPSFNNVSLVKWENTFHMRPFNLSNFPNTTAYRSTHRSQMAINRARGGCVTSSAKSLELLRQNLQRSINQELNGIIQKYLTIYFRPGINNIIANNGENSVSEQHVHTVCRQMLEEAKKMYHMGVGGSSTITSSIGHIRGTSPVDGSDAENVVDVRQRRYVHKGPGRKIKESDTDSEASIVNPKPKKRKGRPPLHGSPSGRSTPSKLRTDTVRREGEKWNPERITTNTQFIMGAKANKALGLGATRGRLYIKHPDVFKYSGDQDDKQWLYDHNLMPATGGKAYMLLVEDIKELAEMEEYKKSPGLCLEEIIGFVVSETILSKMRLSMLSLRTDIIQPSNKRMRHAACLTAVDSLSDQGSGGVFGGDSKIEEMTGEESRTVSPTDELEASTRRSPFSLEKCFANVNSPGDLRTNGVEPEGRDGIEAPPLSAPFDVTSCSDNK